MPPFQTLPELLAGGAATHPAIRAPGRPALDYAGLRSLAERTVSALNRIGIGRGDRVAIVLPNGPEMASAFVAIGSGATTAPLNPAYREDEFAFYMEDLNARALVVMKGAETPARAIVGRACSGMPSPSMLSTTAGRPSPSCPLRA